MTQPPNRRALRFGNEVLEERNVGTQLQTLLRGKKRFSPNQTADSFASSMHQPHFALNLFSIVFFCAGCLMLLMSSHQRVIQLVMSDCQSKTTITETTNSFLTTSEFYEAKQQAEALEERKKRKKEVRLQTAPKPLLGEVTDTPVKRQIEFVVAGNFAPFPDALKLNYPYSSIEDVNYTNIELKEEALINQTSPDDEHVKMFIGITSACCNKKSQKSRNEIRETWKQFTLLKHQNVEIKFFLSQPSEESLLEATEFLKEEVEKHDDMVLVRGLDVYDNLPNKTFGMLKYTLSSKVKYTHFLKTDDDAYVRVHKILESLNGPNGPKMERVYKGCLENRSGFYPIRDQNSKWFLKYEEFDDYVAQPVRGTKYLAGWGYVLSRDVMFHAMKKVYEWDNNQNSAPAWYPRMKWEDVMMGILVADLIPFPDADYRFKAAWRACTNETAIRHLDLDAPLLFRGLYAQDQSGLWLKKTVQCSTGNYVAGDYGGWKRWRNSVIGKDLRI